MGKLIYATNTSLDGYTEDATGSFDWSVPDEDVHEFYNDMMRGVGKPAFPTDLRLDLELVDERRFGNGAVHVAYRVRR